ncbi:hypothetical protein ACH5RR_022976, partial [Cinchona calisaya]
IPSQANASTSNLETSTSSLEQVPTKVPRIESKDFDISSIERDPGKRMSIWNYSPDQQDEVQRAYIKAGPFQHILENLAKFIDKKDRKFLVSWYQLFPDWLEFSPTTNGAYCLQCFLFIKPSNRPSQNAFTVSGFRSWKKVNDGVNCYFLRHASSTDHKKGMKASHDLMNPLKHIGKIIKKKTTEQIARNRLRLQASIDAVKWLSL